MRQRRNVLLVNRGFQIKYSFFVVSWILALSAVYPMITHTLFEYFIAFARSSTPNIDVETLRSVKSEFLRLLILLHVVFMGVIFLISLFMSHKIAGPIYKLRKFIETAKTGNYESTGTFRKSDHFQELADDFNDLLADIRARKEQTRTKLEEVAGKLDRLASDKRELAELASQIRSASE